MQSEPLISNWLVRIRKALAFRFDLNSDQHGFDEIDQNIRDGIELRGTNLWVLMLAIFIASIGLDVNSTAVIIGAMLISPLMGPIMGIGYGAGINDFPLIKTAMFNLLLSILIALFTSTVYFFASPLATAQSELLARTTPTIWDVLIALLGGLAGIIASTRKEKTNVIPGVAIATALMPPLCTAGYGIANGSMEMFLGAFYLFFINGVFIAFATLLLVRYIDPPHKCSVSAEIERRVKIYIYAVVLITIIPSIYLAYGLVNRELFNVHANEFIRHELAFENGLIVKQQILADQRVIDIVLVGKQVDDQKLSEISKKLPQYHLAGARLQVHQTVIRDLDEMSLKKSLLSELLSSNQQALDNKNKQLQDLQSEVAMLRAQQGRQAEDLNDQQKIFDELLAQYPAIRALAVARVKAFQAEGAADGYVLLVNLTSEKALSREDRRRIIAWLKVRTQSERVYISESNG